MTNELDGFEMEEPHRINNRNLPRPRISVIGRGEVLAIYPDDKTIEVMRSERWTHVHIGFKRDRREIILRKSSDGSGIKVRDYETENFNIHITSKRHGIAKTKIGAGPCPIRRVAGDAFIISIADQISFDQIQSPEEPQDEIKDMFKQILARLDELKIRRVA